MDDLSWTVQRKDLYILRHTQGEKQRRRQRERKREREVDSFSVKLDPQCPDLTNTQKISFA